MKSIILMDYFFKLSVQGEKDIVHLSLEVECDICGQCLIKPTVSESLNWQH